MPLLPVRASYKIIGVQAAATKLPMSIKWPVLTTATLLSFLSSSIGYAHADSISTLIAQKSTETVQSAPTVPAARISTRSTIQRAATPSFAAKQTNTINQTSPINFSNASQYSNSITAATNYRYPEISPQVPTLLPAFLSASYDNVDSEYLPLLSRAETQSTPAAREVISIARAMTLNERAIIQGGCWDYLNAVFKRAGVSRDTIHQGVYKQGPYAKSNEIEVGDWLYYINHGYNGVEHSGLFVGWVDEVAKQALILSYAGESRHEPARYRVYDLSNVYQIMRPSV
jgi:hypothetical protein